MYLYTCMQVFISMQTSINPPVCINDVIIHKKHNNKHGAMLATVHMQLILLDHSVGGFRYNRQGQLGQDLNSSVCVCVYLEFLLKEGRGD